MKIAEVYQSTLPRQTFELTNIDSAIDEDVLLHIIKERNLLPTFFGSRLLTVVGSSRVSAAQRDYVEQKYGVKGNSMTDDVVLAFHYNPKDKHIYLWTSYLFKGITDEQDSRYKKMHVTLKIGRGDVEVIDQAEVNKVINDPESIAIFNIAPGMEFL